MLKCTLMSPEVPFEQTNERSWLREILRRESVRFGHFILSSGLETDVYVDAKPTTCRAEAMPLIGRCFLRAIRSRQWVPHAVGGLTTGADPIAFAVARESLDMKPAINAFIVRKEPKKHGMQKYIEGVEAMQGLPVVIIDDVCTTGSSTATAIQQAVTAGMKVLGAICLVDREMGATELLQREFDCQLETIFKLSDLRDQQHESQSASHFIESKI